ncbi:MAG: hypothetical protein ALMCE001_19180 [Methanocorpusculum sp. MCE]|nr:MAG: hypothetical protein ALMCE001_19180 [Methanocorpusculum sp. MCE]
MVISLKYGASKAEDVEEKADTNEKHWYFSTRSKRNTARLSAGMFLDTMS